VNTGQQQHRDKDECGRHKGKIGRLDRHISRTSLLQSSRDQFCNLHVGLQDEIYDGWDKRLFIEPNLTNFLDLALSARRLWSEIRHAEPRTWNAAIDVSLSADLDGYEA
jgi:hypothetical protein